MTNYDVWVLARILTDLPVAEDLPGMTGRMRELAERMLRHPRPARIGVLDGFTAMEERPGELLGRIVKAVPEGPAPARDDERRATLADVCRLDVDRTWPWTGWLPRGALTSLAADPGIGKTLLALTISRNLWQGAPWPDGQPATLPAGTRTLWVPGDHHFGQLIEVAAAYGLPTEAILLNGSVEEPTGRMFLDDDDALQAMEDRITSDSPGLVVVDTVGMTTDRNLCRPDEARQYFEPLMRMAGKSGTPFLLLTHLSKDTQQALGRRIVGASRVVWKLTHPDPDGQPDRRKLAVDKSYALKPDPLGMTIAADGCRFDGEPPAEAKDRGGRPSDCRGWLAERLASPAALKEIRRDAERAGFGGGPLYRAKRMLEVEETIRDGAKWWALPDVA